MPVNVVDGAPAPVAALAGVRERRVRKGLRSHRGARLSIGFVNAMGDGAHTAAERQFVGLLNEAAGNFEVTLRRYRFETLPRGPDAAAAIAASHRPVSALGQDAPDALIVTSAESSAASLENEPYWRELAGVIDFAHDSTLAAFFSDVSARAAVDRLDGIACRQLPRKLNGVFTLAVIAPHALTQGLDWSVLSPQSRWHTLDEEDLAAHGYEVLLRSAATGPDLFVKEGKSLLTFAQGHFEYDAETLGRDFRRDLRLYLEGKRERAPLPPQSYFMASTEIQLMATATHARPGGILDMGPPPRSRFSEPPPWRRTGALIARNWLAAISERKTAGSSGDRVRYGG